MTEYIQVITSVEKREDAEKIAGILLKNRLAACIQILGPVTSKYLWKGKIENSREWLCIIKSKKNLYKKIQKEILDVHSYDIPEILAFPVADGSKSYLEWINKELKS